MSHWPSERPMCCFGTFIIRIKHYLKSMHPFMVKLVKEIKSDGPNYSCALQNEKSKLSLLKKLSFFGILWLIDCLISLFPSSWHAVTVVLTDQYLISYPLFGSWKNGRKFLNPASPFVLKSSKTSSKLHIDHMHADMESGYCRKVKEKVGLRYSLNLQVGRERLTWTAIVVKKNS